MRAACSEVPAAQALAEQAAKSTVRTVEEGVGGLGYERRRNRCDRSDQKAPPPYLMQAEAWQAKKTPAATWLATAARQTPESPMTRQEAAA